MTYQKIGSLWLFHISLVDGLYMSGEIFDRVATVLYDLVLRDPTPADWATSPLESLSVLMTPHPLPYEHWFEAVLKRNKEPELALEIADRVRRHRFFSTLPFGGRLLALRWVLEGPKELLNEQSLLERQDLLAKYSRYQELAIEAKRIETDLALKPAVEEAADARREQSRQLNQLGTVSQAQEVILREIAVRREPVEMVFPPLRRTKDIQLALPEGHALLAFFATSNDNLYGFMFSKQKYAMWRVGATAQLHRHLVSMLKEMGNTDGNRQLTVQDLGRDTWKKSAAKVLELLFDKSNVDLSAKFEELIIVPDGPLWYLPFEALPVGQKDDPKPLISQVRVRYAADGRAGDSLSQDGKAQSRPDGRRVGQVAPARRRVGVARSVRAAEPGGRRRRGVAARRDGSIDAVSHAFGRPDRFRRHQSRRRALRLVAGPTRRGQIGRDARHLAGATLGRTAARDPARFSYRGRERAEKRGTTRQRLVPGRLWPDVDRRADRAHQPLAHGRTNQLRSGARVRSGAATHLGGRRLATGRAVGRRKPAGRRRRTATAQELPPPAKHRPPNTRSFGPPICSSTRVGWPRTRNPRRRP